MFLEPLVLGLPPRLHLVVACRTQPNLRIARLRAAGEVARIGAEDLAVAPDDVADFGLDPAAQAAVLDIVHATGGWPLAVHLAVEVSRRGGPLDRGALIEHLLSPDAILFDYLAEDVLANLSDPERELLDARRQRARAVGGAARRHRVRRSRRPPRPADVAAHLPRTGARPPRPRPHHRRRRRVPAPSPASATGGRRSTRRSARLLRRRRCRERPRAQRPRRRSAAGPRGAAGDRASRLAERPRCPRRRPGRRRTGRTAPPAHRAPRRPRLPARAVGRRPAAVRRGAATSTASRPRRGPASGPDCCTCAAGSTRPTRCAPRSPSTAATPPRRPGCSPGAR